MRKRRTLENRKAEQQKPDCSVCVKMNSCERFSAGSFCTMFQSAEAEKKGTDPNEAWARGDDVEF